MAPARAGRAAGSISRQHGCQRDHQVMADHSVPQRPATPPGTAFRAARARIDRGRGPWVDPQWRCGQPRCSRSSPDRRARPARRSGPCCRASRGRLPRAGRDVGVAEDDVGRHHACGVEASSRPAAEQVQRYGRKRDHQWRRNEAQALGRRGQGVVGPAEEHPMVTLPPPRRRWRWTSNRWWADQPHSSLAVRMTSWR